MHPTVGELLHPTKLGAKFPFWPGLSHSWALFLAASQQFCAENSPPCFSNVSLIRQKSCVTHSRWCSQGRSSGQFHNPSLAFNIFRIMVYAASTLRAPLIRFCYSDASKDHSSIAACSSAPLTFTMHHGTSTGKSKTTQHCNSWCL